MNTPAGIGVRLPNGIWKLGLTTGEGQPDWTGRMLENHYTDAEKAIRMVGLLPAHFLGARTEAGDGRPLHSQFIERDLEQQVRKIPGSKSREEAARRLHKAGACWLYLGEINEGLVFWEAAPCPDIELIKGNPEFRWERIQGAINRPLMRSW